MRICDIPPEILNSSEIDEARFKKLLAEIRKDEELDYLLPYVEVKAGQEIKRGDYGLREIV